MWAERGYAAIAMDLGGKRPKAPEFSDETRRISRHFDFQREHRTRLEHAGPLDDLNNKILNNDGDLNVRRRLQVGYGQDRTSVSNYVLSVQNSEVQTGGNNNVNVAHIDANYIGTTAFTANRSAVALRVDVDASITGHTTTNNQRLTNYSAYFTNNSKRG